MSDWTAKAACRSEPLRLFFPEVGMNPDHAIEVCGRCPVRAECLEFALNTGQQHGVWGGLTAYERKKQRSYRVIFCNVCARRFSWKPAESFQHPPVYCSDACRRSARLATHAAGYQRRKQSA